MAVGTSNYPTSVDTTTELIEAANNAADTLGGAITAISTSLTVSDASEFTNSGIVAIDNELLSFTGKSGNTLTGLTRGIEGTTAAIHSTGAEVKQVISAKSHNVLASAIIAVENKLGTGTDIAWSVMAPLTASRVLVTDGAGDVTVSGVTSTALSTTFGNQTANTVFAGPTTGSAAPPAFRSLVAADIPALSYGDVTGPSTATDNAIARFDGSTGKLIQNSPVTLSDTGSFAFPDGIRQTFNPNGTNAGLNVGAHTADPSSLTNGDLWYNSTSSNLKTRRGAATEIVATIPVNNGDEIPFLSSTTGRLEASGEVYWDGSANAVQIGNTSTGSLRLTVAGGTDTTTLIPASGTGTLNLTLPPNAGTNGQALITNGSGVTSWGTVSTGLVVGTTSITGGTSGRVLYDNAGVVGEYNTTGTGDVVRATSPSLTTPNLGTPSAVTLTNATGLPLSGLPSQAASTLLGRGSSSTGSPEVISLGTGLTMSGTTLSSSAATSPGGLTTQVQFNDAGSFGGDAGLTYDKTTDALTVAGPTTIGELRLKETGGGSDYVGFKAPASVTTNKIWTLPSVDGSSGQVLGTSGAAVLQWQSAREILTANRTYWVGFLPGTGTPGVVTFQNGVATITCNGHGLQANDPVVFSTTDTLPTNFTAGTTYYVRSTPATNTFEVSATAGTGSTNTNTAITAGSAGTGTQFVRTGNDNNIGYGTNGRSVALLTVQKAIDLIGAIDTSIYKTTIKCARGQYADAFWVSSLKTINRLDIIGDDRYLAGLTYFHGADIGHNAPAVMNNLAGNGNATIAWSTGGTVITITGATTNPNISGDGWGANDRIVLFVPGATAAGTFYEYTVSSTTATTITIANTTLPTAPSPMTAGVCVTFIPNVKLQSSSNGGRTIGGEVNVTDTTSVLLKGWHLRVGSNFSDVVLSKDNSYLSCGWNLIDYRGGTQNYTNGFSANSAKLNSLALDALGHMPNSVMGGLAYNSYALIAQSNSEILLRSIKFINVLVGIAAFDRSYVDAVWNQMVSVDTGFDVQRYSYVYGILGQVLNSTRIQSAASPTPSSTNNSQIQR